MALRNEESFRCIFSTTWNQILSSSSWALLKLLKNYHCTAILSLAEEIAILRTRLQERQDFSANINKIDRFTQKEFKRYEDKKKKKIRMLLGQRTMIRKVCRRKKASKNAKTPTGTTTSTVVNISNIPLSQNEIYYRGVCRFAPNRLKLTSSSWRRTYNNSSEVTL